LLAFARDQSGAHKTDMGTLLILFYWVLIAAACAVGFGVAARKMARDIQEGERHE
jgi:hypothetical protein